MNANDLSSFIPYTGKYGFGSNPGWYGPNWSTIEIIKLNQKIGCHTWRMQIYDSFLTQWGNTLTPDYEYLKSIGAIDTACMVGGVSPANADNPFNVPPAANWDNPAGRVFKGMYLPIWSSPGVVNPLNTYAKYLFDVVKTFGQYIKFWEVWNEPDFSYKIEGSGDAEAEWMARDPRPSELWNLRATVPYYNRLLRISWEIIKQQYPNSYVCTGGIGVGAFLDAILRNTDNPDGGKVTSEYPLSGGAYFDVLSFHTYPEFSPDVKHWTNDDGGHQVYQRHSDACVTGHLHKKNDLQAILVKYGYNGTTKPLKHFICTETGMSRVMDNDNIGSNEIQKNYMIKCRVKEIVDGQIKQTYWYQTADSAPETTGTHWEMFGCYKFFGDKFPPNATQADQGIAMATMSKLLFGKTYDKAKTTALNLPATCDGAAFNDGTLCLWAKTTKDLSEVAMVPYTLPGNYILVSWDEVKTNVTGVINLTGTPVFLVPDGVENPPPPPPPPPPTTKTLFKKGYWIINGKYVYYKAWTDGTYQTGTYTWYKQSP